MIFPSNCEHLLHGFRWAWSERLTFVISFSVSPGMLPGSHRHRNSKTKLHLPPSGSFAVSDLCNESKASSITQFGTGIAVKFEFFDSKRFWSCLVSAIYNFLRWKPCQALRSSRQIPACCFNKLFVTVTMTLKEQVHCRREKKKAWLVGTWSPKMLHSSYQRIDMLCRTQ